MSVVQTCPSLVLLSASRNHSGRRTVSDRTCCSVNPDLFLNGSGTRRRPQSSCILPIASGSSGARCGREISNARAQADREGRADEFADAYAESELFGENARMMSARPGMESRTSITTIQELAVKQGTVTPFWWGLWVLIKVRLPASPEMCLQAF